MPAPFVPSRPVHIVGVGSCLGAPIFGPAAGPRALCALGLDAQPRQSGVRPRWEALFEPSAPKPPHPPMLERLALVSNLLHDLADSVAGIPLLFLYVYAVWALLIGLLRAWMRGAGED